MATITSLGFDIFSNWDGSGVRDARLDLDRLAQQVRDLSGETIRINVDIDDAAARASLDNLKRDLDTGLSDRTINMHVDDGAAKAELDSLKRSLDTGLGDRTINLHVDDGAAKAELNSLKRSLDTGLTDRTINIDVDDGAARTKLNSLRVLLDSVSRDRTINIDVDDGAARAKLNSFRVAADTATRDKTVNIDVDDGGARVKLHAFSAAIDLATHSRTATINVDVDQGMANIRRITGGMTGFTGEADRAGIAGRTSGAAINEGAQAGSSGMRVLAITIAIVVATMLLIGPAASLTAGIMLGALGSGFVVLGALALAKTEEMKNAFKGLGNTIIDVGQKSAEGLKGPLLAGIKQLEDGLRRLQPAFHAAFDATAPLIKPLVDSLLNFTHSVMPGVTAALRGMGPVMDGFNRGMSALGAGISRMFQGMVAGAQGAGVALREFLAGTGQLLGTLGVAFGKMAAAGGQAMKGLMTMLDQLIGRMFDGFVGAVKAMQGSLGPFLAELGRFSGVILQSLLPPLGQLFAVLMNSLTPVMRALEPVIRIIGAALMGVATALRAVQPLVTAAVIAFLGFKAVEGVVVIFTALKAVWVATEAIILALRSGTIAYMAVQVALTVATKAMAAAQLIMNAIFAASPIGLVVTAVAALVAGIVYLATQTRFFQTVWNAVWNGIKTASLAIWNGLQIAWKATVNGLITAWNATSAGLRVAWNAVWNGLRTAAQAIWNGLTIAWRAVVTGLTTVWNAVTAGLRVAWNAVWNGLSTAAQAIWNGLRAAWQGFVNVLVTIWNAISGPLGTAWRVLWEAISNVARAIWSGLQAAWQAFVSVLQTIWNAVTGALGEAWRVFWSAVQNTAQAIWNAIQTAWNGFLQVIQTIWNAVSSALGAAWSSFWDAVRNAAQAIWNAIQAAWNGFLQVIQAIWGAVSSALGAAWSSFWNAVKNAAQAIWNAIQAAWNGFLQVIQSIWGAVSSALGSAWSSFWNAVKNAAQAIWDGLKAAWQGFLNGIKSIWDTVSSALKDSWNAVWHWMVDTAKKIWDTIVGVFKKPINLVIDIWNHVAGAVGLPEIKKLADGGHVQGPGTSRSDSIPAMLSDGEYVVNARAVRHYGVNNMDKINRMAYATGGYVGWRPSRLEFAAGGPVPNAVPKSGVGPTMTPGPQLVAANNSGKQKKTMTDLIAHMAGGGILGTGIGPDIGPDIVGSVLDLVKKIPVVGDIVGGITDILSKAKDIVFTEVVDFAKPLFDKVIDTMVPDPIPGIPKPAGSVPHAVIRKMVDGMLDSLKKAKDEVMAKAVAGAQSVQAWAPLAAKALQMAGLNPNQLGKFLALMAAESGGNPNAVNNWDSNAKAGHPSMGLMQVIGPTFQAYHVAGTSNNILDPLANMAAAANYIKHRYGGNVPGSPYAMGTKNATRGWHLVGERGPEWWHAAGGETVKSFEDTVNAVHGAEPTAGGGGDMYITINIDGAQDPRAVVRNIEQELLPKLRMQMKQHVGRRNR